VKQLVVSARHFSNSDDFFTGSVKFYVRGKAYGFLIPDDPSKVPGGATEIWAHRTSFDTPHSADEFGTRPYLYKGERVKFRIQPETRDGDKVAHDKAIDLRFEDGRQVPLFRKNYTPAVKKGETLKLGEFLVEVMKEDSSLSDEDIMEKIKAAVVVYDEAIAKAESVSQQYGEPAEDEK
jgi:cold shock CspA family protein